MKVKFIIAGINKELPIIETDKINIKENEILSINFTNKSKSEYSDFLYLAGKKIQNNKYRTCSKYRNYNIYIYGR